MKGGDEVTVGETASLEVLGPMLVTTSVDDRCGEQPICQIVDHEFDQEVVDRSLRPDARCEPIEPFRPMPLKYHSTSRLDVESGCLQETSGAGIGTMSGFPIAGCIEGERGLVPPTVAVGLRSKDSCGREVIRVGPDEQSASVSRAGPRSRGRSPAGGSGAGSPRVRCAHADVVGIGGLGGPLHQCQMPSVLVRTLLAASRFPTSSTASRQREGWRREGRGITIQL